jgi:predicted RNA-binding Zn ribbon-like protein
MDSFWQDLLHTDWHDYRAMGHDEDRLLKPGYLENLLQHWGMEIKEETTQEHIAELQSLRALLQRLAIAYIGQRQPDSADLDALNNYLELAPSHLHLKRTGESFRLERIASQQNWKWVIGQIAGSFASLLADYDPSRIKQCGNPACRWIYYDESNGRSRRWCDDDCANIMRVRRFRERHRGGASIAN